MRGALQPPGAAALAERRPPLAAPGRLCRRSLPWARAGSESARLGKRRESRGRARSRTPYKRVSPHGRFWQRGSGCRRPGAYCPAFPTCRASPLPNSRPFERPGAPATSTHSSPGGSTRRRGAWARCPCKDRAPPRPRCAAPRSAPRSCGSPCTQSRRRGEAGTRLHCTGPRPPHTPSDSRACPRDTSPRRREKFAQSSSLHHRFLRAPRGLCGRALEPKPDCFGSHARSSIEVRQTKAT
mmetsp:Transcript_58696/g.132849  ORF Transcript_58696/g.132849 Transcript_58696/m.132849 type:complete len:240 (-) Transcript_58696:82-801(-)